MLATRKSGNEHPACLKDSITKALIDAFQHYVFLTNSIAIPFQALRAERQADGFRKILVKACREDWLRAV
jgi:hypothetical protein